MTDNAPAEKKSRIESVADFIEDFNSKYEAVHKSYEDELVRTKAELDAFLGDKQMLQRVRQFQEDDSLSEEDKKILKCFEKTFLCYIIEDSDALSKKNRIMELEADLGTERNNMNLGYTNPTSGDFVKASSVQLRNLVRTSDAHELRLAGYQGLRSIGPFVSSKLCEIVKLRNQLARSLGYECFYDMKVSQAEGFDKKTLFGILDELEQRTRPILEKARKRLAAEKGDDALLPENTGYYLSGDVQKLKDPFFPFENAVDAWARSFAALGIDYRGSVMNLDLCDRQGKYSNGFCHWPQPAWQSRTRGWIPAQTNFTSLASPKAAGSGYTALVTLMHEGGHAAHFANVVQGSPLFSQERAPTSVAYAENQSMFLDSLVGDAAWQSRYATSKEGNVIPWEVIEKDIRSSTPYSVFILRGMLAVPYFEKRLYELSEEEVTPDRIVALADEVEADIQGGLSARPLLSVPHILADESAAYYHGYVLAETAVHQTRAHFHNKYGDIVDNVQIGKDLTEGYWKPGNSVPFRDLVNNLTGAPLSGDAWVKELEKDTEELVAEEKEAYERGVSAGPRYPAGADVDLNMRIRLVHGDLVVSDTETTGLAAACEVYKKWLSELDI